jgi:Transposase IS116/IS110/IS902 family
VTRASLREYAAVQRERYLRAPRAEKHRLLNAVVAVAGLHRKAAIRLLRRVPRPPVRRPRSGRPRRYGPAVATAAQLLSEATGHIGPHRWHPFLPELLDRLTQSGDLVVSPEVDKPLRQVSPATLARLLAPFRALLPLWGATTTRPGAWLKHEIPGRTFAGWSDAQPGFLELDLVAHCGPTTRGFYLCTLCAVDVATSWVDLQAVWGKGQLRVGTAIDHVRQRLPMPLRGVDSDNGSEFINHDLYAWCQREGVTFPRSRPYQKNDSAHVEQKNGAIVRPLIGYDRYASRAAYAQLARVYDLARLHINFFQPVQKLVTKERRGPRVHRVYDRAQTPYQRLCATGVLPLARRQALEGRYQRLNPLHLRRALETVRHLISWAGLCPRLDESAGETRSRRVRKGAPWLKTVLVQCAWAATRTKGTYLQAQYHRVKSRRGPKRAVVAVAASMLTAAYHILKAGVVYRDLGGDYFTQRDRLKVAQRLARRLKDLGYEVELRASAA